MNVKKLLDRKGREGYKEGRGMPRPYQWPTLIQQVGYQNTSVFLRVLCTPVGRLRAGERCFLA